MMKSPREASLARLSIGAFAIDALTIGVLIILISKLLAQFSSDIAIEFGLSRGLTAGILGFISVILALVSHLAIIELIFGGRSFGRLAAGLKITGPQGGPIPVNVRLQRIWYILKTMGLKSLAAHQLPDHNKSYDCFLRSDWIGQPDQTIPMKVNPAFVRRNHPKKKITSTPQEPYLEIVSGVSTGQVYKFSHFPRFQKNKFVLIGKDKKLVDILLSDDPGISSIHCRIGVSNANFLILDGSANGRKSTNGTFIGKRPVSTSTPSKLNDGDIIQLASTKILFST